MTTTVKCDLTGKKEPFWKCARVSDGILCPEAYFKVIEKTGIPGSIEQYKQLQQLDKEHKRLLYNYITTLKKYSILLNNNNFLQEVRELEALTAVNSYKKNREFLTKYEEEMLISSILLTLEFEYPKITGKLELVTNAEVREHFHPDHNRYFEL